MEIGEVALQITLKAMEQKLIKVGNESETVRNIASFYSSIHSELRFAPSKDPTQKSLQRQRVISFD